MWKYICVPFLVLIVALLLYQYYVSYPKSIIINPNDKYDYIVVGAGTAGCVIASRLSQSPNVTVLLIEAGGYFSWLSRVPLAAPMIQQTEMDWSYKTEPQYYSSKSLQNFQQLWPRGKGLGGSGQLNYLVHSFGRPEDYENWPPGWNYHDLYKYFITVKSKMSPGTAEDSQLLDAFLQIDKSNLTGNVTIERTEHTINNGARWSTFQAYLQKAWFRDNIHILPETIVTKILFDNQSNANSIEVKLKNNIFQKIHADKEIILCAGTIGTPHLLMISGIGPYHQLKANKIPIVRDSPQVGQNLFDHLNLPIYVDLSEPVSFTLQKLQTVDEVIDYFAFGSGILGTNGVMGIAKTDMSAVVLFGIGSADEHLLKDVSNFETESFRALFPSHNDTSREGFLLLISCLQPKSRGNITLNSDNIFDPPRIDPAYLEDDYDISCTQDGIKLMLEIVNSESFKKLGAQLYTPNVEDCNFFEQDFSNPDYSECIIRFAGLTGHHPGGTCKMGTDSSSVVDTELKVNGVHKLRIGDASVMPTPVSGAPSSVIIAIAEHLADIIRNN